MLPGTLRLCPLCQSDDGQRLVQKGELCLVRCRQCKMIYRNAVEADLEQCYERLAYPYYLTPTKLAGDHAPLRFQREIKLLRHYCPSGAVLDVGCSTGGFLDQLRRQGTYRTVGIDVATSALAYTAGLGIEVWPEPFLTRESPAEPFDAVTFWAVLEHVKQPREFLAQAARFLRNGGYCFVLVPNWRSLAVWVLGERYRYIMKEHVNYFTAATLRRMGELERSCEVVTLESTHFNPLVILQDLRCPRERVPEQERAALLSRTTRYKQSPLLAPIRPLYHLAEKILGRLRLADNLVLILRKKH